MRPARLSPFVFLCLLLMTALPGWVSSAAAQQQEKRIALVVGNGAYAKGALATTANDAGLIAQNLQAAGFDVIGARDLNGDTLRKSFHDFMQKVESAGQNTVAMIYLAGYGVQLAGENYFIPVDTDINRDSDIPTEAIRISDYMHQLASLPLKASIVVLDAARQQPFIEGNSQIASGLALVDPENNMLIAYNAAPGTIAPTEPGPYGVYAQSLAEMIRTGGLALPDVFDRVRMRVNETTKGAQVPWDAQKIQAQFFFFDRAPDAPPAQGPADQVAAIRTKPIRELPAQEAYSAAIARDTLQGYEDFVLGFASDPMAPRVRAIIAARREAITWRRTYLTDTPQAYWSYLRRYPNGPHAWDARRRLTYLSAALEPPPSFAMIDYDVPPPPPAEFAIIDRPVVYFGDPVFGFAPPPPPPVFFLPPPPPDFVVLPPPFPVVGLFVLPQPRFVAFPAFVRPPAYVAPPPNNVVFNNIHNTTVINNVINVPPQPGAPGVGPQLTPSALQQSNRIQQGQAPMPKSAVQNGTAATTSTVTPSNATAPNTNTPATHTLPGGPGGQQLPQQGKGTTPGTTLGTTPGANATAPGVTPNTSSKLAPNTGSKLAPTTQQGTGTNLQQKGTNSTSSTPEKPPLAQTEPTSETKENLRENAKKPAITPSPSPSPSTAAKPTPKSEKPVTSTGQPKIEAKPEAKPAAKPEPRVEQKRATPPPPAPKPAAAPKPPAPAPKPPPPPPKPQAAPKPPPAPRPAPPPPPPKPAAAAKKCKPGEKC
ncbi:MAG TPA: caspase family protein [Bradyrhizobium sp.]|nr:caspase family protein [Bradyrhizobium sp.]